MRKFDAIIIGSGPNGLAAAITFQQQGLSTLLIEGWNCNLKVETFYAANFCFDR